MNTSNRPSKGDISLKISLKIHTSLPLTVGVLTARGQNFVLEARQGVAEIRYNVTI